MSNEDWKKLMITKNLDAQLHWLIESYERYLTENENKWVSLRNASSITNNFIDAVDYNNREGYAQKERYEWLLEYISQNYIPKEEKDVSNCVSKPIMGEPLERRQL